MSAIGVTVLLSACRHDQSSFQPVSTNELVSGALALESKDAPSEPTRAAPPLDSSSAAARLEARASDLVAMGPQFGSAGASLVVAPPLDNESESVIVIGVREAVLAAVHGNIPARSVRVETAIRVEQLLQAQAAFDMLFTGNASASRADQPAVSVVTPSGPLDFTGDGTDSSTFGVGVQQELSTGGAWSLGTQSTWTKKLPLGSFTPNPSWQSSLTLGLEQPLLRGFGSDVAFAQVHLAKNATAASILTLRQSLLDVVERTEQTYWQLASARQRASSAQWLLEQGIAVRNVLARRLEIDASGADYAEAVSVVEQRAADLVRARLSVALASDQLKLLIENPQWPVGQGAMLVPSDDPSRELVSWNLRSSIVDAMEFHPTVLRALIEVDSSDIRITVAENGTLPALDLAAQVALQGLDGTLSRANQEVGDADFVNWLVGITLAQPIGNRAPESLYREARLRRAQSALAYRRSVDQTVTDVRAALRTMQASADLMQQTRTLRLAAAESVRSLEIYEASLAALSPEFLQLKFMRQQALASAHMQEFNARADYQVALARLRSATGTSLDTYGISVEGGAGDLTDMDSGIAALEADSDT